MNSTNQLMTIGAIGFAVFAVWQVTRKAPGAIANQPGQQQRDAGLATWNEQQMQQWTEIANYEVNSLARRYPAPTTSSN